IIEKKLDKTRKAIKGDKKLAAEVSLLERILKVLEEGKSDRILDLTDDEKKLLKGYQLLSTKPIIYVANVSEEDVANDAMDNELVNAVREFAKDRKSTRLNS